MIGTTGATTILLYGLAMKLVWVVFAYFLIRFMYRFIRSVVQEEESATTEKNLIKTLKVFMVYLLIGLGIFTSMQFKPRLTTLDTRAEDAAIKQNETEAKEFKQVPIAPAKTHPASPTREEAEDTMKDAAAEMKEQILRDAEKRKSGE